MSLFFIILIYFLPTLFAIKKEHGGEILLLNLLTGWTVIGWIASFVWAVCDKELKSKK